MAAVLAVGLTAMGAGFLGGMLAPAARSCGVAIVLTYFGSAVSSLAFVGILLWGV